MEKKTWFYKTGRISANTGPIIAKQEDNVLDSVRPSTLSSLKHLTCDLDIGRVVIVDLGWVVIVGQGRRSKVKVKCEKIVS